LAGRHGPPSQTTFYLSLATAALRGLLVAAALALGFFVLSKAFPSGDAPSTTTPGEQQETLTTAAPVSPSPTDKPPRAAPEAKDPSEITLQVLNGTDVSGLASDTAQLLEEQGYQISTIADAETSYEVTTLFHKPKAKADAQFLADAIFSGAVLEVADDDIKVDITVNIGADYAATLEESGSEPEEEAT
jgi:LytR cell envelope-related transcriptional attenuator